MKKTAAVRCGGKNIKQNGVNFRMILLDEYKSKLADAEKMLKEAGESL